jgi:hypothetical protein
MRIIKTVNGSIYINQALKDYVNNIWATFNKEIPNDKNIFFLKNTTIPRIITDYSGKNISRVIKKEKAEYCIIKKFDITNYPIYYDALTNSITEVETNDVVYNTTYLYPENYQVLEQILDFFGRGQVVEYVNQDVLNDSLNNGFILDKENYTTIKQLLDSRAPENITIATSMIVNSDLEANLDWILYLYHQRGNDLFDYDNKDIVRNYYRAKNINLNQILSHSVDNSLAIITNQDVKDLFVQYIRAEFNKYVESSFIKNVLHTNMFELVNFELKLK